MYEQLVSVRQGMIWLCGMSVWNVFFVSVTILYR